MHVRGFQPVHSTEMCSCTYDTLLRQRCGQSKREQSKHNHTTVVCMSTTHVYCVTGLNEQTAGALSTEVQMSHYTHVNNTQRQLHDLCAPHHVRTVMHVD